MNLLADPKNFVYIIRQNKWKTTRLNNYINNNKVESCRSQKQTFNRSVQLHAESEDNGRQNFDYLYSEAGKFLTSLGFSGFILKIINEHNPDEFELSPYQIGVSILRYGDLGFTNEDIEDIIFENTDCKVLNPKFSLVYADFFQFILPYTESQKNGQLAYIFTKNVDVFITLGLDKVEDVQERLENIKEVLRILEQYLSTSNIQDVLKKKPVILLKDYSDLQSKLQQMYFQFRKKLHQKKGERFSDKELEENFFRWLIREYWDEDDDLESLSIERGDFVL